METSKKLLDIQQLKINAKEEISTDTKPLGREIICLSRKMGRYLFSTANHEKIKETTSSGGWAIAYIGDRPEKDVFQRDLEKEFGITRSTASKNIDLLERDGFITRQKVEHDARLKKLVLTEKAESILDLIKADRDELERTLVKGFSGGELKTLHGFIERLLSNLETDPEETT